MTTRRRLRLLPAPPTPDTAVEGAIAFCNPTKTVPKFKFTQNGGKREVGRDRTLPRRPLPITSPRRPTSALPACARDARSSYQGKQGCSTDPQANAGPSRLRTHTLTHSPTRRPTTSTQNYYAGWLEFLKIVKTFEGTLIILMTPETVDLSIWVNKKDGNKVTQASSRTREEGGGSWAGCRTNSHSHSKSELTPTITTPCFLKVEKLELGAAVPIDGTLQAVSYVRLRHAITPGGLRTSSAPHHVQPRPTTTHPRRWLLRHATR